MSAITRGIRRSEYGLKPSRPGSNRLPTTTQDRSPRFDSKPKSFRQMKFERSPSSKFSAPIRNKYDRKEEQTRNPPRTLSISPSREARVQSRDNGSRAKYNFSDRHHSRPDPSYGHRIAREEDVERVSVQKVPKHNPQLRLGLQAGGEVAERPIATKRSVSIIRSTAASEFIYGRSSVFAALKAGRRVIYNIYLYRSLEEEERNDTEAISKHASNNGIKITWLSGPDGVSEMDRIVKGRPHNGVILEAGPLPRLPVSALEEASRGGSLNVRLRYQNQDEEEINGSLSKIPLDLTFKRYPFVIMLDEIIDQGNLGGILRSAYFLGADAVVLSSHMAAMNAVTLKAASGAAEDIRILSVHNTTGFLESSKENGWEVYAAVAPPSSTSNYRFRHVQLHNLGNPLQDSPCILLLGGEGNGLRRDLVRIADRTISIPGQRSHHSGIDSLNVSVAAGILINGFLRDPNHLRPGSSAGSASQNEGDNNVMF